MSGLFDGENVAENVVWFMAFHVKLSAARCPLTALQIKILRKKTAVILWQFSLK